MRVPTTPTNKIALTSSKKIKKTYTTSRQITAGQQTAVLPPQPTRRPSNQTPYRTCFTRKFFARTRRCLVALSQGHVVTYPQLPQQRLLGREHVPSVSPDFVVSTRYRRYSLAQFDRWRTARGRGLRPRRRPEFALIKPRRSHQHAEAGRSYVRRAVVFRRRSRTQLWRVLRRRGKKHFVQLGSRP
jgi:hypothetical protein